MKNTLIVIFGQVRTLEHTMMSIYNNILLKNKSSHVILSIDGTYQDIPPSFLSLFKHSLLDIYVTHNKDNLQRDHERIEFELVANALKRVVDINDYEFILKIRTDVYIKYPIDVRLIYGKCSLEHFSKSFQQFAQNLNMKGWKDDVKRCVKSWILTGGLPFFIDKQLDESNPPISPWCIDDLYHWNHGLFHFIDVIFERLSTEPSISYIHAFMRKLLSNKRITFLIGSTWIHFGEAKNIYDISLLLADKHTTMQYPNKSDDDELSWIDHKGEIRTKKQSEWKFVTDNQIRIIHQLHDYGLIDLVNKDDYIESFDAKHSLHIDKRNPNLFAWIVRERQVDHIIFPKYKINST